MAYNSSCYFDCSQPPPDLPPYPDISGVGVLIGYTATAGIVVLILLLHYHLAHDPTKDPFHKESDSESRNPLPNPVDVVYLSLPSRILSWLRPRRILPEAKTYPRLEAVFINCVQSMSDLQILTGTSILISGYVQLRCGLSAFHWQIIVLLAWFSSITHLSCLTFLRNHLYNRPVERVWRLIAMGLMLVMLLVALIPTGGYNWTDIYYSGEGYPTPKPRDYAICYLRPPDDGDRLTFSTMVISVVLLALGFVYRVIRLHKSLSVFVVGRARKVCSGIARHFLRLIYSRMDMETSGLTFNRIFLYRPLLASFLTIRALLDLWNSMFIEILWMAGSFSWGVIRLLQTLHIQKQDSSDWSFGQVVPLVLLAAPLFTIFESFFKAQRHADTLAAALMEFHTGYSQFDRDDASSHTPLQSRDHPDRDFYQNSSWAHSLIYLMVAFSLGYTSIFLSYGGLGNAKLIELLLPRQPYNFLNFLSYFPIYQVLSILTLTMLSMLLEDIGCIQGNVFRSFMGISRGGYILGCKLLLFSSSLAGSLVGFFLLDDYTPLYFLTVNVAMYCLLSATILITIAGHGDIFIV